jgi:hypothetical protein
LVADGLLSKVEAAERRADRERFERELATAESETRVIEHHPTAVETLLSQPNFRKPRIHSRVSKI